MTRGFITIATGEEIYYKLAKNLLLSYKLFCDHPMPFAIMCDRENEYTTLFDKTIVFQPSNHPYFDKFLLLTHSPFDETIFIDSDCLAYANLNEFWDYFDHANDFSSAGTNYTADSSHGLFQIDEIGIFHDRVSWKPNIHGGLYFIRKGPVCDNIYKDCQYIVNHYHQFHWPSYCAPYADEPVLSLAMAANGCKTMNADPANYGIPWEVTEMSVDIFTGKCQYATQWHSRVHQGRMIHWSVRYCHKPLYLFETEKLHCLIKYGLRPGQKLTTLSIKDCIFYKWKLRYFWLLLKDFFARAIHKVGRILKIIT